MRYGHITLVLKEFHSLQIDENIEFKVALKLYTCLCNEDLVHLTRDLIILASPPKRQIEIG